MGTTAFRRLAASTALPTLLAGAVLVAGVHTSQSAQDRPASATATTHLAQHGIELAADKESWHTLTWKVEEGRHGYATMVSQLRDLARAVGATRESNTRAGSSSANSVDSLNNQASDDYAAVRLVGSSTNITVAVRLSDLYLVGYWMPTDASSSSGHHYVYYPIAPTGSYPQFPGSSVVRDAANWTTHTTMIGTENYNDLARSGNLSLNQVGLSTASLDQSIRDLRATPTGSKMDQTRARALLRLIVTISEGTRFRPLAAEVSNALEEGTTLTTGDRYVELIRNWRAVSEVYQAHRHDAQSTAQIVFKSWGTISTAYLAAKLLLAAMSAGNFNFPKGEF